MSKGRVGAGREGAKRTDGAWHSVERLGIERSTFMEGGGTSQTCRSVNESLLLAPQAPFAGRSV